MPTVGKLKYNKTQSAIIDITFNDSNIILAVLSFTMVVFLKKYARYVVKIANIFMYFSKHNISCVFAAYSVKQMKLRKTSQQQYERIFAKII